ncbi:MAG TPA: hypothetical protein PLS00_08625, partial [Niabella sp.]|nr:hypothetical protein [Niabella sp.]
MFTKELTYQDAENIQTILEAHKEPDNILKFEYTCHDMPHIDESLFEFYMGVVCQIRPVIIAKMDDPNLWRTTDRLKVYIDNEGGFIENFKCIEKKQRQEDEDK